MTTPSRYIQQMINVSGSDVESKDEVGTVKHINSTELERSEEKQDEDLLLYENETPINVQVVNDDKTEYEYEENTYGCRLIE